MKYWTTREGKKLKVVDMETDHIKNCIRMLKRVPDQDTEAIMAEEYGFNLSAAIFHERAECIEEAIQSFESELRYRELGKPIGEEFPQKVIQRWETEAVRNNTDE